MFFEIMRTRKGFTLVELIIVVAIMGILVAVAVPVYSVSLNQRKIKDCQSQSTVVEALVKEAMYGMLDNGHRQPKIDFSKISQSDHATTYKAYENGGYSDTKYNDKKCFVLGEDQALPGVIAFTLGDLRGGYRNSKFDDYDEGFNDGHYLKKEKLKNVKFYTYLSNQEIPVCPFADFTNNDKSDDYRYFIFEDGSVICSCSKCHE